MRENLRGAYQKYVCKFIQWVNEQDKLDLSNKTPLELISRELTEYITEIWGWQKSTN